MPQRSLITPSRTAQIYRAYVLVRLIRIRERFIFESRTALNNLIKERGGRPTTEKDKDDVDDEQFELDGNGGGDGDALMGRHIEQVPAAAGVVEPQFARSKSRSKRSSSRRRERLDRSPSGRSRSGRSHSSRRKKRSQRHNASAGAVAAHTFGGYNDEHRVPMYGANTVADSRTIDEFRAQEAAAEDYAPVPLGAIRSGRRREVEQARLDALRAQEAEDEDYVAVPTEALSHGGTIDSEPYGAPPRYN